MKSSALLLQIETTFKQSQTSAHGMLDNLLELWEKVGMSYKRRMQTLTTLSHCSAEQAYSQLQQETATLAKRYCNTYELIARKEHKYGNISSAKTAEL